MSLAGVKIHMAEDVVAVEEEEGVGAEVVMVTMVDMEDMEVMEVMEDMKDMEDMGIIKVLMICFDCFIAVSLLLLEDD